MNKLRIIIVSVGMIVFYSTLAQVSDTARTVVLKRTINTQGKPSQFSVETGYLDWKDENNEMKAKMFFTAYTKDGENASSRPITFAFNGGPGSSSLWLHIGCMGPRVIEMDEKGDAPAPPYRLIDNHYNWLDLTDIVFIDPVGTGFSRPVKGEKDQQFYGYKNDISSVGEFIRLYLNKQKRWISPKYVAGESYGTTRAAGLSRYLITKHAIFLNGIILVSAALDFETLREFEGNDLANLCFMPGYTATAFYHKKLSPELQKDLGVTLQKAERFVETSYAAALFRGNALSAREKDSVATLLALYTGTSKDFCLKSNLRIYSSRFRKALISDSSASVGRFDSRLVIHERDEMEDVSEKDASFTKIRSAFSTCINEYLRTELKYNNDLPYNVLASVSPWEYANGRYLNVMPELAEAMVENPDMKVWVASGFFDLATPYYGATYSINHIGIPASLQKNFWQTYYEAGHMFYLHKPSMAKLRIDAAAFYGK